MCSKQVNATEVRNIIYVFFKVGGNTLGFLACQIDSSGEQVLGVSFNGSFHLWVKAEDEAQGWLPEVTFGGHFGPVEDLDWERKGRYVEKQFITG